MARLLRRESAFKNASDHLHEALSLFSELREHLYTRECLEELRIIYDAQKNVNPLRSAEVVADLLKSDGEALMERVREFLSRGNDGPEVLGCDPNECAR
jgi:hypothetical protein